MDNRITLGVLGPIKVSDINLEEKGYRVSELGMGGINVSNLINGFKENQFIKKINVYTLDKNCDEEICIRTDKIDINIGPINLPNRFRALTNYKYEVRWLLNKIKKDNNDVLSCHWAYEYGLAAIKSNIPSLITLHDNPFRILQIKKDLFRFSRLILNLYVVYKAKNLVSVSPYIKNVYSWKENNIVIPNSINVPQNKHNFSDSTPLNNVRLVSIYSSFDDIKNPKTGLIAFDKLADKYGDKVSYDLYGKGFEKNGIADHWIKKNLNNHSNIFCNGYVKNAVLMEKLWDYDILLHTSKEESFGMILIEALARGVIPVGGKGSGAVPWILSNGKYGVLTNINSPFKIFSSLDTVLSNLSLYQNYRHEIRNFNINRFSNEVVTSNYINEFKRIIE